VIPTYAVPDGWLPRSASRAPLRLVNAFAFARSSTPPPDQWTHFAQLRPVPWRLLTACIVITLVCVWGIVATLVQYPDELFYAIAPLVILGLGAAFFGRAAVESLLSYRSRTGWPHLHGVGLGASGVALRLAGGDADVPWSAVTAIRATRTNETDPGRPQIPVLQLEYAGSTVDLDTGIIGASPLVLYWALLYYWQNPASRDELGTTLAQARLDAWLEQVVPVAERTGAASS
jgi:hypothetical protein